MDLRHLDLGGTDQGHHIGGMYSLVRLLMHLDLKGPSRENPVVMIIGLSIIAALIAAVIVLRWRLY